MLAAYFDESGTHEGSKALVIAGWVSSVSQWKKFQAEWRQLLDEYDLDHFHMTDCENLRGQYQGWTQERKISAIQQAHKIIVRRISIPIAVSLDYEAYDFLDKKYTIRGMTNEVVRSPYTFCLEKCLSNIKRWADRKLLYSKKHQIEYIFEHGNSYRGEVTTLFQKIEMDASIKRQFRVSKLEFGDKYVFPLNAADMLAYETFKEMENYHVPGFEERPLRKSSKRLVGQLNQEFMEFCGRPAIEKLFKKGNASLF